jgi:C1q domain
MSSRFDEFLFGKKRRNDETSVFRADRTSNQELQQEADTQVLYTRQLLDTNNEYDPTTSTFIPGQNGVYSFIASIVFLIQGPPSYFGLQLQIRVNNVPVSTEIEYFPSGVVEGQVSVDVIQQLRAGDRVTVFARSSRNGIISLERYPEGTRFEGARIG